MRPCEQCVYVRFAAYIIAFGSLIAFVFTKNKPLKTLAFTLCAWGIYLGFTHSFLLQKHHNAFREGNPFGISGCSHTPHFPFALPLDTLFPKFFSPNGVCGFDAPLIPAENISELSALQSFFVGSAANAFTDGFYSNGWFVLPQFEFLSMADMGLLVFGAFALGLGISFCLWGRKNLFYALCSGIGVFALMYFA